MIRKAGIVAALFIAGAVTWNSLQQQSAAQAVEQRTIQKWEYQTRNSDGGHLSDSSLENLGSQGWELVAVWAPREARSRFVFKRPKK